MIGSVGEAVAVFLAGIAAGCINTIVGSGTLITFPVLLAVGLPPVTANVSNTLGLFPGSISGSWGYRRELVGQGRRLRWLIPATIVGGIVGALLVLLLPASAFREIVPVLIGLGVVLVAFGPMISRRLKLHGGSNRWVWPAVLGTGVYGGYFGAAQGVILMAVFGLGIDDTLQRQNALKNVLSALANLVAAVVFVIVAANRVDWRAAVLLAVGAVIGGQIGATVGRRLPAAILRAVIIIVGTVAIVAFVR